MASDMEKELDWTINSLVAGLRALFQFKHTHTIPSTTDGGVDHLPLCIKSISEIMVSKLKLVQDNISGQLPSLLDATRDHFGYIPTWVEPVMHSCEPSSRLRLVDGLTVWHENLRIHHEGEVRTADPKGYGVWGNVGSKTDACVKCGGPCRNPPVDGREWYRDRGRREGSRGGCTGRTGVRAALWWYNVFCHDAPDAF
jgi:hypothetical protein